MSAKEAVSQLKRSPRGQRTVELIREFLRSPAVNGLDGPNSEAVVNLVAGYLCGGGAIACAVREAVES